MKPSNLSSKLVASFSGLLLAISVAPASQALDGYELELIDDSNDTVLAPRAMENQAHYFDGNLYFDAYGDKGYGVYFLDPEGNTNLLEPPFNFAVQNIPMITSFGNQLLVAYQDKRSPKRAGVWVYENGEWTGALEEPMDAYYPEDLDIALDDRFVTTPEGVFFFARDINDQVRLVRYDGSLQPTFKFEESFQGSYSSTQSYLTISYEPASASANRNARIWTTMRLEVSGLSTASTTTDHQDLILWFDAEASYPFDMSSPTQIVGGSALADTEFLEIVDHQVVGEQFVFVVNPLPGSEPLRPGIVLTTDKANVENSVKPFSIGSDSTKPLGWTEENASEIKNLFTSKPLKGLDTKLLVVGNYSDDLVSIDPATNYEVVAFYDDEVAIREAGANALGTDVLRIVLGEGGGEVDPELAVEGNFSSSSELIDLSQLTEIPSVTFSLGLELNPLQTGMAVVTILDPMPTSCDPDSGSEECMGVTSGVLLDAQYSNAPDAKLTSVFSNDPNGDFKTYFSAKNSVQEQDDLLGLADFSSISDEEAVKTFEFKAGTTGDSIAQYIGSDSEGIFIAAEDGVSLTVGRLGGEKFFVDTANQNAVEGTIGVTPWGEGYLMTRIRISEGTPTFESLFVDSTGVTSLPEYYDSVAVFDGKLWLAGSEGEVPLVLTETGQIKPATDFYDQPQFSSMKTAHVFSNNSELFISHSNTEQGSFLTKFDGTNLVTTQTNFAAAKLLTVGANTFVTAFDGSGDPESLFQLNQDMSFSKVPFPDAEGKYQNVTHMFDHLGQLCVVADIADSSFGGSGQNVYCLQNGQMRPQMTESLHPDFQVQQVVSAEGQIFFGAFIFDEELQQENLAMPSIYELLGRSFIGVIEDQSLNFLQFDGRLHSPTIAADNGLILQVHDPVTGLETYRLKKILENTSAGFNAPVGFTGPVITNQEVIGNQLVLSGTNLSQIKAITLGNLSPEFELLDNKLFVDLEGLVAGAYQPTVSGDFGSVQLQQFELGELSSESSEPKLWTKQISPTEIKLYAKNIVGNGKIQFFHNGSEVAWVRAEDDTDPKLRLIGSGPMAGSNYLVRTREMVSGKNVFEIYVDGERVLRRAQGN